MSLVPSVFPVHSTILQATGGIGALSMQGNKWVYLKTLGILCF